MLLEGESIVAGLGSNEFGFGFYDSWRSKRWNSPHQFDEITAEDRMRIRSNIINAFAFMNGKAEFD